MSTADEWPQLSPEFLLESRAIELVQRVRHLQTADRKRILAAFSIYLDNLERSITDAAD